MGALVSARKPEKRYGNTATYRLHFVKGGNMSLQTHIEALKERHAMLDMRITEEDHRPRPDDGALIRMKLEKLRLKEQMERLRTQSASPN
jgi:hypothetical protein